MPSEGIPRPRTTWTSPGWTPGGNSSSTVPSGVPTETPTAERRLDHRHVHGGDQIVAVAFEALVRSHAHEDENVAGGATLEAGMPFSAQPDPLSVVDSGRHLDVECAIREHPARALAACARRRR